MRRRGHGDDYVMALDRKWVTKAVTNGFGLQQVLGYSVLDYTISSRMCLGLCCFILLAGY